LPFFKKLAFGFSQKVKRVDHKVACPVCGKMYGSNYCLTIHMGSMHAAEKQFQCEYCGMKFAWKKCYERHISSVHLQVAEKAALRNNVEVLAAESQNSETVLKM
jgi:uncharacterized C2H2 Zn-finger protein